MKTPKKLPGIDYSFDDHGTVAAVLNRHQESRKSKSSKNLPKIDYSCDGVQTVLNVDHSSRHRAPMDAYDEEDDDTHFVMSALAESRESLKILVRTPSIFCF